MTIAPVHHSVSVRATPERAFEIFTSRFGDWWPGQGIGSEPLERAILEPRVGGRWYEVGKSGTQCDWGKVLVWTPPRRLVLAWQIDASFKYDAALVTEVEVTFEAQRDGSTLVTLEHRNLERFGDKAGAMRDAIGAPKGWPAKLAGYARYVNS